MSSEDDYKEIFGKQLEEMLKNAKEAEKRNKGKPYPRPEKERYLKLFLYNMPEVQSTSSSKDVALYTSFITGNTHSSKKALNELKPITLNQMMVPKLHENSYLLCRTVSKAKSMIGTMVLIEDTNGDIEELALYNFKRLDTQNFLPFGTIMIIKEPYMKYSSLGKNVAIRVDSPSDVIFLDQTDELLKSVGWMEKLIGSFESIKSIGNEYFRNLDYENSIIYYKRALKLENSPVIYLNLAAAYLHLNRFFEAYNSAKEGFEMGGNKEKALFRMAKAAYGMRDWIKANEHYKSLIALFPDNNEFKIGLDKTKLRLEESQTGKYDLRSLYEQSLNLKNINFDVADYIGPVMVSDIEGKGKGLIASEDILKGKLLMVSKAFSISIKKLRDENNNIQKSSLFCLNLITNKIDTETKTLNLIETVQNLRNNPQRAKELYSLYTGDLNRSEEIPNGVIDIGRIENICCFNSFEATQAEDTLSNSDKMSYRSSGLWILPSYLNHSCLSNTYRTFYGDIMTVHAIKDIKKGEEITCSYLDPFGSYKDRLEKMQRYKFECKCDLCVIDQLDTFNYRRYEMFKSDYHKIKSLMLKHNIKPALELAIKFVDKMRKTYHFPSKYKISLFLPIVLLAHLYDQVGDFKRAATLYNEAIDICGEYFLYASTPHTFIRLAACYKQINQQKLARDTLKKAIHLNKIRMGADKELFKIIYADFLTMSNINDLL